MIVFPPHVCAPPAWLLPLEDRRGRQIPWTWTCRWLWVLPCVLGIKLRSSVRATGALNQGASSPALVYAKIWSNLPVESQWTSVRSMWCYTISLQDLEITKRKMEGTGTFNKSAKFISISKNINTVERIWKRFKYMHTGRECCLNGCVSAMNIQIQQKTPKSPLLIFIDVENFLTLT